MLTKFKAEVKARFEEDHAALSPSSQPPPPPPKQGKGKGKDGDGTTAQQQASNARTATQVGIYGLYFRPLRDSLYLVVSHTTSIASHPTPPRTHTYTHNNRC